MGIASTSSVNQAQSTANVALKTANSNTIAINNLSNRMNYVEGNLQNQLDQQQSSLQNLKAETTANRTDLNLLMEERRQKIEEEQRLAELERKRNVTVTTNINAVKIDFEYEDGEKDTKVYFAKQDKPSEEFAETTPVPIEAKLFYLKNDLVNMGASSVTVDAQAKRQPPSIKSITKDDTDARLTVLVRNPSAITVYFGFKNLAGIAVVNIYESKTMNKVVDGMRINLHSSSDNVVYTKGIEVASNLDYYKNYILEIKHSGTATNFNILQPHEIYVSDIAVHRVADATNCIREYVSNDNFTNNFYVDDGSKNSITGRKNYVEFFDTQIETIKSINDTSIKINASVLDVKSVEVQNTRTRRFSMLYRDIDYDVVKSGSDTFIRLRFEPKINSLVRIKYDTISSQIARKIELTQPVSIDGEFDRYRNIHVQNEAIYVEINANQ